MFSAIKNKLKKWKYGVAAYLAFEVATFLAIAVPATAQMQDRVSFSVPQRVISATLPLDKKGQQSFLVSSNAAFAILSENAIGEFDIALKTVGAKNSVQFGTNAQLPGTPNSCANAMSSLPMKIYEAERKTAARSGDVLSQAIRIDIHYDASLTPDFKVITQDEATNLPLAGHCANA